MKSKLRMGDKAVRWVVDSLGSFREHGPCEIETTGFVFFSQINYRTYNRASGPAFISPDGFVRYTNGDGALHRTDGPARIYANGSKDYWVNNKSLSPEEFFVNYGVF